jgi:environmental stress-induced protein Ves
LLLDPAAVPATPWRNGAGVTRELWVSPGPGSGIPEWRLSLAELSADAAFSPFPGLDRVFLPLAGDLSLTVEGRVIEAVRHQPIRFRGEDAVSAEVRVPGRALNLMVRRGVLLGDLRVSRPGLTTPPTAPVAAIVRFDGFTVDVLLTREGAA